MGVSNYSAYSRYMACLPTANNLVACAKVSASAVN